MILNTAGCWSDRRHRDFYSTKRQRNKWDEWIKIHNGSKTLFGRFPLLLSWCFGTVCPHSTDLLSCFSTVLFVSFSCCVPALESPLFINVMQILQFDWFQVNSTQNNLVSSSSWFQILQTWLEMSYFHHVFYMVFHCLSFDCHSSNDVISLCPLLLHRLEN